MRKRSTVVVIVVIVVLALGGLAVWRFAFPSALPLPLPLRSEFCTAQTNGEVTLTLEQMANAATITAVGIRQGVPERAITVALATALQESKLRNLDGGDRDSIGLFQQRPSQGWGTPKQIADPRYAAGKFYSALLKIKNWQRLSVSDAAQSVQRSAAPDAYSQWANDAQVLAAAFMGDKSAAVACTVTTTPHTRGPQALSELTDFFQQDWGTTAPVRQSAPDSLIVAVTGAQTGWQYAHWLVAHASDSGVQRVQFGGRAWTADAGTWTTLPKSSAPTKPSKVVAQVYAAAK